MKIIKKKRIFYTGFGKKIKIKDSAHIFLKDNEQVTFKKNNLMYDFCKKNWGYYVTASINKRLKENGFETYLIENITGNLYLWAVEKNKKKEFLHYLNEEKQKVVLRLDNINSSMDIKMHNIKTKKDICSNLNNCFNSKKKSKIIFEYFKAPPGEPDYCIKKYYRKIAKCKTCGHYKALHNINTKKFYLEKYSTISHGKNIEKKFNKIKELKTNSDNFHRVERILFFFKDRINKKINLLDVGSGISIFIYELKKKVKWIIEGIEPDKNFVNFAKNKLGLNVKRSSLENNINRKKFDIITLNKVIEHVKNPSWFLKKIHNKLKRNGYIYVEVPDGETASKLPYGKNREEFYLDHLHVFSLQSLSNCLAQSKFKILVIDKIREPSGKYTLFAFAKKIL